MQPTQVVNSVALNRVCVTDCPQGNNISCISCITTNGSGIACYEERDRKSVGGRESAREREEKYKYFANFILLIEIGNFDKE
jgi:hypothetical protein